MVAHTVEETARSTDSLIDGTTTKRYAMTNSGVAAVPANGVPIQPNTPSLLLRGLRKSFADVVAVDGLDLEVTRGECFGLLGPNGAGKTTTIEICEGLTRSRCGTVELLGLNWASVRKRAAPAYRHSIAGDPVSGKAYR